VTRRPLLWLAAFAAIAVLVTGQVLVQQRSAAAGPVAGAPTVHPGTDVLAGVSVVAQRNRGGDYRRAAFGKAWDDENTAPGGHNGCDTRDDILNRDLDDKTYVATRRCVQAVAGGSLRDPYTNATIPFTRGNQVGAAVQIDHIVPLAYAWDMGARDWSDGLRKRFANDPANLLAVAGEANQDKGDLPPGEWMPPNAAFGCQYAVAFIAVLRGYHLAVEENSAHELRRQTENCPAG
jgi:hypothetical protein